MFEAKKILDWLKLSPKQAFILLVVTSVLLFGSESLVMELGLKQVKETLQPWLGAVWLLSLALFTSDSLLYLYKWCRDKILFRKKMKRHREQLHNLTVHEQQFLAQYIIGNTKTVSGSFTDGVVQELVSNNIIRLASTMSQYDDVFPYNIQPWAWRYLQKNPSIVGVNV